MNLKLLATVLIATAAFASTATPARANWPECYMNSYINNTQQYILVRADRVSAVGGLSYGKGVPIGGQMKYFVRTDGSTRPSGAGQGPTYYVCVFSDVPLVQQQQQRVVAQAHPNNGGPVYVLRFKPKGVPASHNPAYKTVRVYASQHSAVCAQMNRAGWEFAYSTME